MQAKRHLIYGLTDPRTGALRYVGRSSSGLRRPRDPHGRRCQNWINSLKKLGLLPTIIIIQEFDPTDNVDDVLNTWERHWIAYYRSKGANLTNLTDGGERGRKFSSEVIQHMCATRKGSNNPFFGKQHSDSAKIKMRSPVVCLDDGKIFPGLNLAAGHYGVAASSLSLVCNGKRKRVGGLRFSFVET